MNTGMIIKRQLIRAIAETPNVLEEDIATQRQQLADQLGILRRALDGDDFDQASIAAGHVSTVSRALHDNLEMQSMTSLRDLSKEFTPEALIAAALKDKGGKKAVLDAAEKLKAKPGAARVRS